MELTQEERARLNDSKHKIQSVAETLAHVDPRKVPDYDEIRDCLESADNSLRGALGSPAKSKPEQKQ